MTADGDNCSSCRKPLAHNSRTFGGVNAIGTSLLVGECCQDVLKETVLSGLYLDRSYGDLDKGRGSPPPRGMGPSEVDTALQLLQQGFAFADQQAESVANLAGLPGGRPYVTLGDTEWKRDDADWFRKNSTRSHRLRPLVAGEKNAFPGTGLTEEFPPRHELQVLVRQVAPGQRMRLPFVRNIDIPIPDVEAVIHALFDIFGDSTKQRVVHVEEVVERALRYEDEALGTPQ